MLRVERTVRDLVVMVLLAGCAGPPAWPAEPELSVGEVTSSRVVVSWPAADRATAYVVRIDGQPAARLGADARSYAADELDDVSEHAIEVEAVDDAGRSSTVLRATATTLDGTAPAFAEDATLALTTTNGSTSNVRDVELRWPAATDNVAVARYRVLRDGEEATVVDAPALRARIEDVALVDAMRFEVRALDAAGNESERALEARYAAARDDARLAVERAQAEVEAMLLGALGDSGAFQDVFASSAELGNTEDVLAQAEGVGVASGNGPWGERSGGGGLAAPGGGVRGTSSGLGGLGGLGTMGGATEPSTSARVSIGEVSRAGGAGVFDETLVTRMLRVRSAALRVCYQRELRADPELAGSVVVRFTVAPAGGIEGAQISRVVAPGVDACALEAVRRLRFNPGPEGGPATFDATISFSPR